jgi:beta-glucanase (GH16 family)
MIELPQFGFYIGKSYNKKVVPPSSYNLIFEDTFDRFNINNWQLAPTYADFQPTNLNQYWQTNFNDNLVTVNDNLLHLGIKYNPKTYFLKNFTWNKEELKHIFNTSNDEYMWTIPTECGKIYSIPEFLYGWFEASIMLPTGIGYWPAFWLSGAHSWGPEIDIFEAYSFKGIKYPSTFGIGPFHYNRNWWAIETNLHYGDSTLTNGPLQMHSTGATCHHIKNTTKRFVQYVCHWTPTYIKIYYDGNLIYKCTNTNILKWFNISFNPDGYESRHNGATYNPGMRILLNHGIDGKMQALPNYDSSDLIVQYIRVYQ